jgi:hypothetical protein
MSTIHKVDRLEDKLVKLRAMSNTYLNQALIDQANRQIELMIRADHALYDAGGLKTRSVPSGLRDKRTKAYKAEVAARAVAEPAVAPWVAPPGHAYVPLEQWPIVMRKLEPGKSVTLPWDPLEAQKTFDPALWSLKVTSDGCVMTRRAPVDDMESVRASIRADALEAGVDSRALAP